MGILDNILAAFIFLAVPAPAEAPVALPVSTIVPVPEQYQGNADMRIRFVHPWDVEIECHGLDIPNWVTYACYDKDRDLTILPNPCLYPEAKDDTSYAYLTCHEKGHKNGWKH